MTVMSKLTGRAAKPVSTLGALPKLTDHAPYNEAVLKALKIWDYARPIQEELGYIDTQLSQVLAEESAAAAARSAAVAEIIAGAAPVEQWRLPAQSARLRSRRRELVEKLQLVELAMSVHNADSVQPARAEALRLAQVGVVRDHFGPAVVAMLTPLAEFVRKREAVMWMLAELEAAGLDGGPVSNPWFPAYLFGNGCDFAEALRQFVRDVADTGSITATDAATLTGS